MVVITQKQKKIRNKKLTRNWVVFCFFVFLFIFCFLYIFVYFCLFLFIFVYFCLFLFIFCFLYNSNNSNNSNNNSNNNSCLLRIVLNGVVFHSTRCEGVSR